MTVPFVRDLPVDAHNRVVEVDVCPPEPQGFVLPEAEGEGH